MYLHDVKGILRPLYCEMVNEQALGDLIKLWEISQFLYETTNRDLSETTSDG